MPIQKFAPMTKEFPTFDCWIPLVEMDAEVGGLAVAEVPTYLRKERRSWIH
jgi:hypothetical protein